MTVLLTGMCGAGKSALVHELRRRGSAAHDADDRFAELRADGRWGWRTDRVAELLAQSSDRLLFFAGCSEEQAELPFDYRVLLTSPRSVLLERLRTRTSDTYGHDVHELAQVLADFDDVEPLLRRSADLVLTATDLTTEIADVLLRRIGELRPDLAPGWPAGGRLRRLRLCSRSRWGTAGIRTRRWDHWRSTAWLVARR